MEKNIWLVYNKSTVSAGSPINMDGSEYVIGVSVVPALNKKEALALFHQDLEENQMKLLELNGVVNFPSRVDEPNTKFEQEIERAAKLALERDMVYYLCTDTSETIKDKQ